jgi:plasmid maintenance system antidote protein VapI
VRVEKAFGVSMDTLMRMQNSYDIAQARERASQIDVAPFNAAAGRPAGHQPPPAARVDKTTTLGKV